MMSKNPRQMPLDLSHPLDQAIHAIATEMVEHHEWSLDEDDFGVVPETCVFYEVMRKHLAPLLNGSWRQVRIAALKAELAALGEDSR